jgi:serine/threonine protein kinase
MQDRVGEQFGDYRLIGLIGSGGYSDVYLGENIFSKSPGAVKILSKQLVEQEDIKRFVNEIRSLFRLTHPNILEIIDFGFQSDFPYLVMYYASNGTLAQRHPKGAIVPPTTISSYVKQIAAALQFAHDHRIIHRDVKPQNMLVGSKNEILLSDFGLATIVSDSSISGEVAGTIHYMAPEQLSGKPQPTSDQYALGITAYQWLCGDLPYHGSPQEILFQHISVPSPYLHEKVATISPSIEKVVLKALSKDPMQRYETIVDFANALEQAVLVDSDASFDESTTPRTSLSLLPKNPTVESDEITVQGNRAELTPSPLELNAEEPAHDLPIFSDTPDEFATVSDEFKPHPLESSAKTSSHFPNSPASKKKVLPSPSTLLFPHSLLSQVDIRDFFIVYTKADRLWARWIAWELEEANYSVILPPWYIHAQSNFEMEMQKAAEKARRTILLLSPDNMKMLSGQSAYITALMEHDQSRLLAICVRECGRKYRRLLDSLHHIDIAGEDEALSRIILLASTQDEGVKLTARPVFPGPIIRRSVDIEPVFPQGNSTIIDGPLNVVPRTVQQVSTPSPLYAQGIEIFFSYSHKDKKLRSELEKYMTHLKRHPSIKAWYDGEIGAGKEYAQEILTHLNKAHIILLLVSQDFIASDYCYNIEMQKALQRHEAKTACVIPIILRQAFWENTPIGKLQALPTGAKPITLWSDRNQAYMDVVRGIQKEIQKLVGINLA